MTYKAKFETHVDNRDLLNVGDYINLFHFTPWLGNNACIAKIVDIVEVHDVHKSEIFKVVGFAKYLNRMGKEIANCEIKYHAREIC